MIYSALVLSGGGTHGIEMLGALQFELDAGRLSLEQGSVKLVVGTSVGAIVGYLVALGYTPIEILVVLVKHIETLSKSMAKYVPAMDPGVTDTGQALLQFAPLRLLLETMTVRKSGCMHTMRLFEEYTGTKFVCVAFDYTQRCTVYLDSTTHPDMPCLQALEMSAAVPIIFETGVYNGHKYLDGCIGDNFAVGELVLRMERGTVALGIQLTHFTERNTVQDHTNRNPDSTWKKLFESASVAVCSAMELCHAAMDCGADTRKKLANALASHRGVHLRIVKIVPENNVPLWQIESLRDIGTLLEKFSTGYAIARREKERDNVV